MQSQRRQTSDESSKDRPVPRVSRVGNPVVKSTAHTDKPRVQKPEHKTHGRPEQGGHDDRQ